MNIAIVVDSISSPTKEQREKYQFEVVPINVRFEGKIYKEGIDLTCSQAYQFLEKNPEEFATSAPSPGDFLSAYKKAVEKGAKEILCLTLSAKVSATYNSAVMAKDLIKNEFPNVRIEVVDTEMVASAGTLLCLAAAQARDSGKNFAEIIQLVENLKKKVRLFISLETIRYIYRTGRVPEVASKLGSILPLKPILTLSEGKVRFFGATTSKEKSVKKVLKIMENDWNKNLPEIGIAHADCLSEAEELKNKINQFLPSSKIFISECSPIIGYGTGRGTLLIAYFAKN